MTTYGPMNFLALDFKGFDFEIIASNLTKEQEEQLRAAFAEE